MKFLAIPGSSSYQFHKPAQAINTVFVAASPSFEDLAPSIYVNRKDLTATRLSSRMQPHRRSRATNQRASSSTVNTLDVAVRCRILRNSV